MALQTPLSMAFSKNTGVDSYSLLQRINPGIEPGSLALRVDSLRSESSGKPYLSKLIKLKFLEVGLRMLIKQQSHKFKPTTGLNR